MTAIPPTTAGPTKCDVELAFRIVLTYPNCPLKIVSVVGQAVATDGSILTPLSFSENAVDPACWWNLKVTTFTQTGNLKIPDSLPRLNSIPGKFDASTWFTNGSCISSRPSTFAYYNWESSFRNVALPGPDRSYPYGIPPTTLPKGAVLPAFRSAIEVGDCERTNKGTDHRGGDWCKKTYTYNLTITFDNGLVLYDVRVPMTK